MPVIFFKRPLPLLHFKVRFYTDSALSHDVTITSQKFAFSFTFEKRHHSTAIRFSRLCNSILLRLREFFFSKTENPDSDFSHLILPLVRIIDEIIKDYNSGFSNFELPESFDSTYSIGTFTLPSQTISFTTFLLTLKKYLLRLLEPQTQLTFYNQIDKILRGLDIALCMILFQTNYIHRIHHVRDFYDPQLISNESKLRRKIFIDYKHVLVSRTEFCLS